MSVIAWDGKSIVADKQATNSGLRFKTTKLRRIASGEVLAWTGGIDFGLAVASWYEGGADPAKWPKCQASKDDWSRLIVATKDVVKVFEQEPFSFSIEDEFQAWGSGRDYAMAAMALGASAAKAVEIAMRFDPSCGLGTDSVVFE